jgi:hypothetical protein
MEGRYNLSEVLETFEVKNRVNKRAKPSTKI